MMKRWHATGGYKEVLDLGMPLVVSMLSSTVMTFTDRIFLGNYSIEALGASMPASLAAFLFLCFFMGVAEYVGVFVAQYTGAAQPEKVGRAVWVGLWFCVPSGLILASLWFAAEPLFALAGHPEEIRSLEVVYFRILTLGSVPFLFGICLSCFFSGRGMTKPVMIVSMAAMIINIPLDYCLINGVGPFPEMGIVGAGIATVIGYTLPVVAYTYLIFTDENERLYKIRSAWKLDRELFRRFMKFGLPGGVEFFLDIFAVSFFVFMVGRIGPIELTATNAVFSIYNLAFLPTVGLHIAASIMVGQAMGDRNVKLALYSTKSVFHIAIAYMGLMAVIFLVFPDMLVNLFRASGDAGMAYDEVLDVGVVLMRYVTIFTLFDAVAIIYVGGLKGAGDSRFIMLSIALSAGLVLVGPMLALNLLGIQSVHAPWICLVLYVVCLAGAFYVRFRKGPWQKIEMISQEATR